MTLGTFFPILVGLATLFFILSVHNAFKAINRHNRSKARGEVWREKARKQEEFLELVDEDFRRRRRAS